jgi:hypothetical protein
MILTSCTSELDLGCLDIKEYYINKSGYPVELVFTNSSLFKDTFQVLNQDTSVYIGNTELPVDWDPVNPTAEIQIIFDVSSKCLTFRRGNILDSLDVTDPSSIVSDIKDIGKECPDRVQSRYFTITDYHYQQAVPCSTLQNP